MSRVEIAGALILMLLLGACSRLWSAPPSSWPENEITNYRRFDDQLATAGKVSPAAVSKLAEAGFKTIIDLRTRKEEGVAEEAAAAERAGIRYVNVPVTPATLNGESVREVADVLDRDANRPVLLHCSSGNRAAGVLELYRSEIHGVARDDAHAEALAAGLKSPAMIEAVERVRREMASNR